MGHASFGMWRKRFPSRLVRALVAPVAGVAPVAVGLSLPIRPVGQAAIAKVPCSSKAWAKVPRSPRATGRSKGPLLSLRSGRREQRSLALAAGGSAGQDGACPQATAGVRRTTRVSRCPQRTVRSRPQGAAKQTHRSGRGVKPERAPSTAGTGSSVQPGQRSGGNVASASAHIRDCQVRSRVQMPGRFHRILHGRAPLSASRNRVLHVTDPGHGPSARGG